MDSGDIPEVLVANRQNQLIFLTGLDIVNNRSHAAVFSAFTVNREQDRPPIDFVMLDGTQTFCESKAHQQTVSNFSYGFIKVDWFKKYVRDLPSVIVLFADLDWDHPSWNEKATECESKISSLRTSIGSHATRICIVLLQQIQPMDSPLAVERTAKLCQLCQLPTKQLFILTAGERMFSSVLRLETAFHELAQAFYQQCLKSIRARSIPNNFSNLIIRQQFKLAFISELRQDTHTALRHYKLAYQHCTECEIVDSEIFELRAVAGLLNYKICQLSFFHSAALEALAQQRRHNNTFFCLPPGSYPSPATASIEHLLWKGKQCSLFANLFERAVIGGLVAVSTQHPGMYLQAAAYYYRQANEAITALNTSQLTGSVYPSLDPLVPTTVFYGQRPWRAATEDGSLSDPETEKNAVIALELRCSPNHDRSIALLSSAMSQFKKYKCLRMQRYMMLLLSDEYFITGQYVKALQFASHLIWECRREGFMQPITTLLLRALVCAFRVADVKEFMTLSMQMLNLRSFPTFASITEQIMANIELIRQGFPPHVPIPNASISSAEIETCQHLWKMAFAERVFFSISAPRIDAFIRARVAFLNNTTETVHVNSLIFLMVALSSYSSKTIFFERMKITVSDGSKETGELPLYEFTEDNVEISPRKETVKMYKISLPQSCCTSARQLIMNGLSLEMGSIHSSVYGTMDWDAQSLSYGTYDNSYMNSILDACVGQTILKIEPREAYFRLEGTDQSEALLGEIATIPLSFICEENSPIESIRLDWCLDTKEEMVGTVVFVDEENRFVPNGTKVLKCSNSQIPPFKVQLNIRYCSQTICSTNMSVTVSISLDDMTVQKRFLVYLRSRSPFDVESKILTINNDVIENPLAETNFFIRTNITTVADMVISDISWKAGTGMETDKDEKILLKDEICCLESDVITVSSPVRFSLKAESKRCDLGEIYIRWRRNTLLDGWVLSQLSTGSVLVKNSPLSVEAHPRTSYLIVRTAIPVIFTIRNLYDKVIDLQMMLELADVFVFAGNKKIDIRLLPSEIYEYKVSVMALCAGRLPFPKLTIRSSMFDPTMLDEITLLSTPDAMFILPLAKM
uniref:Foie-gras_1 domain-containing protein n=1 Tax=Wuchereria bancrofti TaxID=6293 RepID=A0AAF5Q4C5_WUCBA